MATNGSSANAGRLAKARDMVQIGAYQSGHDSELDLALHLQPQLNALLQQDMHEASSLADSRSLLCRLAGT